MFPLSDFDCSLNPEYVKCRIHENTLLDIFSWKPLTKFCIPRQVTYHHTWKMYDQFPDLMELHAHPDSEVYETFDGALYNKRTHALLYVPKGKTSLHIPAQAAKIGHQALNSPTLSRITLDPCNPHFRLVDGCLYDSDMKTLHFVPESRDDLYIPASLEHIADYVLQRPFAQIRAEEGNQVFSLWGGALCRGSELVTLPRLAESLHIPAHVTQLPDLFRFPCLRHVTVDQNHPDFVTWDNVLYNLIFPQILFIPRDLKHLVLPEELSDLLPYNEANYVFLQSVTVPVTTRFSTASFNCFPTQCRIFVRMADGSTLELPRATAALASCIKTLQWGTPEIKAGTELFHLDLFLKGLMVSDALLRAVKVSSRQILEAVIEKNDVSRMQAVIADGRLLTLKNIGKLTDHAHRLGRSELEVLLNDHREILRKQS